MITHDHANLLDAVVADPDDALPRLALADFHEERGEALEAECWRWFATTRRRPDSSRKRNGIRTERGLMLFWWFPDDGYYDIRNLALSLLPRAWCYGITDDENDDHFHAKCFFTAASAYTVAVVAWHRLTDDQRREAWKSLEAGAR